MVDDLTREITEPEQAFSESARADARKRLLLAARAEARLSPNRRFGRRGLSILLALVAVPTGVAVAAELSRDEGESVQSVASCPDLQTAAQNRGIDTENLLIAGCPDGAQIDGTVSLLGKLERLGVDNEAVGVIGGAPAERSSSAHERPWALWGVAGSQHSEQP